MKTMKKGLTISVLIIFSAILGLLQSCKKATIPELTTVTVSEITVNTAISGGTIITDGGEDITEKGVCWNSSTLPTISDYRTTDGNGTADFTSTLTGLTEGTTYYLRAYATNSVGTAYGNEVTFTTGSVSGAAVTTNEASSVKAKGAVAGGNVTNAGGGVLTEKGICWNTSPNPTPSDNKSTSGSEIGEFSVNLTGLEDGTIYYYRAYAINSAGTTYGQEYQFLTLVEDVEGNEYSTVKIGDQIWMAENLKTTKFADDSEITYVEETAAWTSLDGPAYCWYETNPTTNKDLYGGLYNWYAASTDGICPTGWHVPTDEEFTKLEITLGLPQEDANSYGWRDVEHGSKMKSSTGWKEGETGSNSSGFTALPGGYRYYLDGSYQGLNSYAYWWSSTEYDAEIGWYRRLDGNNEGVYRGSTNKEAGKAIRCIKD